MNVAMETLVARLSYSYRMSTSYCYLYSHRSTPTRTCASARGLTKQKNTYRYNDTREQLAIASHDSRTINFRTIVAQATFSEILDAVRGSLPARGTSWMPNGHSPHSHGAAMLSVSDLDPSKIVLPRSVSIVCFGAATTPWVKKNLWRTAT